MTISTELLQINLSKVTVRPPKKYDDAVVCKIDYNEQKKFMIDVRNVVIAKHISEGHILVLTGAEMKKQCKKIVALEDSVLNTAYKNANEWFGDKIKLSKFETHFHSCAIISSTHGHCLKIKYVGDLPESESQEVSKSCSYNVILLLQGIKFTKTAFSLIWKIHEIKKCDPLFIEVSERESDSESELELDIDIDIKEEIMNKLMDRINSLDLDIEKMNIKKNVLASIKEDLENSKTINEIIKIGDNLEQID